MLYEDGIESFRPPRGGAILTPILRVRTLSARWVPRLLISDQKIQFFIASKQCLDLYESHPTQFSRQFVMMDESDLAFWFSTFPSLKKLLTERVYGSDSKVTRQRTYFAHLAENAYNETLMAQIKEIYIIIFVLSSFGQKLFIPSSYFLFSISNS